MIDIRALREKPDIYRANIRKKGLDDKIVSSVLNLDEQWRDVKLRADKLRHERNKISESINQAKKQGKDAGDLIKQAREIPEKLRNLESEEKDLQSSLMKRLSEIPNLMHPKVPKGRNEKNNKVRKVFGRKTKLKFPVKTHVEILEDLRIADFDASANIAGNGFYYLKGDMALLNRALINFVVDFMAKKGYEYIEPPLMINRKVASAAGDLEAFKDSIYKIDNEDLYLIPTSEHAILGMMSGKTIPKEKLPLKFFGYSMCFRKEIGSHGINEKGLWRTHQFNKVEQFIFCNPEDSWKYFEEMQKNGEQIMRALKLPFRVIEICSGDLSSWKARQYDTEAWRPTTKSYGEVTSTSNCTDYQARDLDIRSMNSKGEHITVHTLNSTAIATSRILVAIIENYQQKDGTIKVPTVLQKYMHRKKVIGAVKKKSRKKIK